MKKIALILVAAIFFIACDKHEHIYFDGEQTGLAYTTNEINVILPVAADFTATANIDITTSSPNERTYDVTVDVLESDLPVQNYALGTITIPANSYNGTLEVVMNDTALLDLTYYTLKVDMALPSGTPITVAGGDTVIFNVIKKVICNDFQLDVVLDSWGSETSWDITDSTGTVVEAGGPYADGTPGALQSYNFTLADGCYTFTIYDAFGDGLSDGTNDGSWDLSCSVLGHASGSGSFGSFVAQDFCVND